MSMRGGLLTRADVKSSEIRAVVTRANGDVEDYGVVAYWHRNPLRRLAWSIRQLFRKRN